MSTIYERVKTIVVDKLGVDEADVDESSSFVENLSAEELQIFVGANVEERCCLVLVQCPNLLSLGTWGLNRVCRVPGKRMQLHRPLQSGVQDSVMMKYRLSGEAAPTVHAALLQSFGVIVLDMERLKLGQWIMAQRWHEV